MAPTNFTMLFWDTINQRTMSLSIYLLEYAASNTHPAMNSLASWFAAVFVNVFLPIWIINWMLYQTVLECTWSLENPPEFLDSLAWYMGLLYDPPSIFDGSHRAEWVWFLPFSSWHRAVVMRTILALPNSVAELAEGVFDDDDDED